jgi:hypothetical protein
LESEVEPDDSNNDGNDSNDGERVAAKNLNLRLNLASYRRFHNLRMKLKAPSNEAALLALISRVEGDLLPLGIQLELVEVNQRLARLLQEVNAGRRQKRQREIGRNQAPSPKPIRPELTWERQDDREWFPVLESPLLKVGESSN